MNSVAYSDCVKNAAVYLRLDDVVEALESGGGDLKSDVSENVKNDVNSLLNFVNLVVNEIACDYIPLKKTVTQKTEDCRIYFKNFTDNLIDIYSVKSNGKSINFKRYHDCILLPYDAKAEIEYSYAPVKGSLKTKLEWGSLRVSPRIIAYGAACEYCIVNGMTDEAALWDKRYKDGLFLCLTPKGEQKIRLRKWI